MRVKIFLLHVFVAAWLGFLWRMYLCMLWEQDRFAISPLEPSGGSGTARWNNPASRYDLRPQRVLTLFPQNPLSLPRIKRTTILASTGLEEKTMFSMFPGLIVNGMLLTYQLRRKIRVHSNLPGRGAHRACARPGFRCCCTVNTWADFLRSRLSTKP